MSIIRMDNSQIQIIFANNKIYYHCEISLPTQVYMLVYEDLGYISINMYSTC